MKKQVQLISPSARKAIDAQAFLARINSPESKNQMMELFERGPSLSFEDLLYNVKNPNKMRKTRSPCFGFMTSACQSQPPLEGCLITVHSFLHICKPGQYLPSVLVGVKNQLVIPAIKVKIHGVYSDSFKAGAKVSFSAGFVSEQVLLKYGLTVGANDLHFHRMWKRHWGFYGLSPDSLLTFEHIPLRQVNYNSKYRNQINDRPLKANKSEKSYLAVMLMWDFWKRRDDKEDAKNGDLKDLGLVSATSDRRSFNKLSTRLDCFTFEDARLTMLPSEPLSHLKNRPKKR